MSPPLHSTMFKLISALVPEEIETDVTLHSTMFKLIYAYLCCK